MYSRIFLRKLTIAKSAIFRIVEKNYKKLVNLDFLVQVVEKHSKTNEKQKENQFSDFFY